MQSDGVAFHELWFGEGDDFMTSPLPIEGMNGVWWSQEERLLLAKVCVRVSNQDLCVGGG